MSDAAPTVEPFEYPAYEPLVPQIDVIGQHFSDAWNADKFITRYQGVVRYCNPLKKYYIWNGLFWQPDDYSEIKRLCQEQIADMLSDVTHNKDRFVGFAIGDLLKHLIKSINANKIRDTIFFLESNRLTVRKEELDADRTRITTENCVVNLETILPEKPSIERYLTRKVRTRYNPGAKCEKWLKHLDLIFGGDQDTVNSFQMIAGYSLLYYNPQQLFFIHHGQGQNGKSVTMKVLKVIWGDLAKSSDYRTFVHTKNDDNVRTDIARLYDAHLVLAVEGKENGRLNEQLIKWITGGDDIVSRGLYEKEQEKPLYAKIHLVTNPKPQIFDTSEAMLRRIIMIPYLIKIPEGQRDGMMEEKLLDETEGIFMWCLAGLKAWIENGRHLKLSLAITDATAKFKEQIDSDREFFADDVMITGRDEDIISKRDLFNHYAQWYQDKFAEFPAMSLKVFNKKCEAHRITRDRRVGGGYEWIGVKHLSAQDRENKIAAADTKKEKARVIAQAIKDGANPEEILSTIEHFSELVNQNVSLPITPHTRARIGEFTGTPHSSSLVHQLSSDKNFVPVSDPLKNRLSDAEATRKFNCLDNCGRAKMDWCRSEHRTYPSCETGGE